MLALAMTLLHDPEVLAIDELSLGLAPLVVQELLGVIERLKAEGMTIILVEQSLNVALVGRRPGRVPREGPGALRGPGGRARRTRRPRASGVPRDGKAADRGRGGRRGSRRSSCSTALIAGLEIGLLAMGIVLIYRSTRVINFAVGNMGLVGASLLALLVIEYEIPFWLAAIGCAGRRHAVRHDHGAGRDPPALLRAARRSCSSSTIGISGLALAIVTAYPEITDFSATYPPAVDTTWSDVLGVRVTGAQLAVLVVVPIVALALGWFLNRTLVGRTVKASAENPDLARVQGINPKIVSTAVWSIAGFLATLTMMLVAADNGGAANDLLTLGPNTLVRALAAAVIAGMVSFPRAMVAGIAIGVDPGVGQLQLPRQARPHRRTAPGGRADRGGSCRAAAGARRRRRRSRSRPRCGRSPSNCATSGGCSGLNLVVLGALLLLRDPPAAADHAAVAPPALRHHRVLRDLRAVADRAHRMGGTAVARSDGLRRASAPWSRPR